MSVGIRIVHFGCVCLLSSPAATAQAPGQSLAADVLVSAQHQVSATVENALRPGKATPAIVE